MIRLLLLVVVACILSGVSDLPFVFFLVMLLINVMVIF